MKFHIMMLIRKTLIMFLLLMIVNIFSLYSLHLQTVKAEESHDANVNFEIGEPNVKTYSLAKDTDVKLSENFMVYEFRCYDGSDEILIDLELVRALQYIRDYFDKPVHINSAYRTKEHNEEIGGCEQSYNLLGQGIDFYVEDTTNIEVAALAERMGIKGIIVFTDKEHSLHIDSRAEAWYACYSHENDEYEEMLGFGMVGGFGEE